MAHPILSNVAAKLLDHLGERGLVSVDTTEHHGARGVHVHHTLQVFVDGPRNMDSVVMFHSHGARGDESGLAARRVEESALEWLSVGLSLGGIGAALEAA